MTEYLLTTLAEGTNPVITIDWANVDLSPITNAVQAVAPVALPIMVAVSAVIVGFRILKRFISMAG
jgi:hypothetical protein